MTTRRPIKKFVFIFILFTSTVLSILYWMKSKVENILNMEERKRAIENQLNTIYYSYMDNTDFLCHRKLRMGNVDAGGWDICDDIEYRPIKPCIIFSFGLKYYFSFEEDASKIYGCQVHSFNPTMKDETYRHSDDIYLYKIGIRGEIKSPTKPKEWQMATFSEIRSIVNYNQDIIDVVTMDVEDSEWDSLALMAKEGQLQNVRQLLVEYHSFQIEALTRLNVLVMVEENGFRRFYSHKNPDCGYSTGNVPSTLTYCYEVHYVNTRLKRPPNDTLIVVS